MNPMKNDFFDDTFLARWITNSLTLDELTKFKNYPEYQKYLKIKQASEKILFSEYDVDTAFKEVISQQQPKKTPKVISLYKIIGAIAAVGILLFGLFIFKHTKAPHYKTEIAVLEKILLPDGSKMQLHANSTANISKKWDIHRNITLNGEAFFNVKKGKRFSVKTNLGIVEVLGTQFSVNSFNDELFIVKCFQGKVKVSTPQKTLILAAGDAYQWANNRIQKWKFEEKTPLWISKSEISFRNTPLPTVIKSLENHYEIKVINPKNIPQTTLFTGNYTKKDLNLALYTIFSTVGLKYELSNSNKVRIIR